MASDDSHMSVAEFKRKQKYASRLAFSKYVNSKEVRPPEDNKITNPQLSWRCCDAEYSNLRDIHCHVARQHKLLLNKMSEDILEHGCEDAKWSIMKKCRMSTQSENESNLDFPLEFTEEDVFPWLPKGNCIDSNSQEQNSKGRILLFYKYRHISNPEQICSWQRELCRRLGLTGKVRVAGEGLNATVGGTLAETQLYMTAVMAHPLFSQLTEEDFKISDGDASHFPAGLKVGQYKEAVPIGIDPKSLSFEEEGGTHLSPEDFHKVAEEFQNVGKDSSKDVIFLDCRNFYESKIGRFSGSLAPNIRKFSYFPEYIDQNLELFRDKSVYMYCTGGIRCERGSVYLKRKGVCKDIYQLKGGIHKYIEKYPDGLFKGKMFVFDDRYAIPANSDVISKCTYCSEAWDQYQPCTSAHCHQLVLSCLRCRSMNRTACCATCQQNMELNIGREQCECTQSRARIPSETTELSSSLS